MPLSWNEIKDRALRFSKKWEDEFNEKAEAKSFLDGFFDVFGVDRKRIATFEQKVHLPGERRGYIDLLWKGVILIEQKSRGKDLDRAFEQAKDYFPGLKDRDLPRYILVCDFDRFRLYDLEEEKRVEFHLSELRKNVHLFGFLAGYLSKIPDPEDPVNIKAAESMARIHDSLKESGYSGHELEVYLVRLLFCLFADDTGIFEKNRFQDFIEQRTQEDGSDLGERLIGLFEVLNTPEEKRQKTLDEQLAAFRYINGKLFEERLPLAAFNRKLRDSLLHCSALDWSEISPAIFGSLFQGVMDPQARRNLGAHYTSEKNIQKLIGPLFLDDLREEFRRIKSDRKKLEIFHDKLAGLKFLDPACGCGNFLVVTYRELRLLELEVLKELHKDRLGEGGKRFLITELLVKVNVNQFYGIEIEEFPARIAEVALWLTDHQMNNLVSKAFGEPYVRLPLKTAPNIHNRNALRTDWVTVVPKTELSFILGNPPFSGAMLMNDGQRADIDFVFGDFKGAGVLDFVSAWYYKAAFYIQKTTIKVAYVSTNSIVQGEQVGILWNDLINKLKIKIHFAHQTFRWNNEAKGKAAVHVIIVGFASFDSRNKRIYFYNELEGEAHSLPASNINPYLIDAPDVLLQNRPDPICDAPKMKFGSMPRDGGHLIFDEEEKIAFILKEPKAEKWIKPYIGSQEFINSEKRWCLWLLGASPAELKACPSILEIIEKVKDFRLLSKAASTRRFAATPSIFCQIAQPSTKYLLVPSVSSERRNYIPMGFFKPDVIANNLVFIVPDASPYHFGVFQSQMHMAWVRYTCGRLKSDYRYSKDIVYNNFPWPENPSAAQKMAIENSANEVLEVRKKFKDSTLADLYDPLTMPPELHKAHTALDKAVDAAYGKKGFGSEADRVAFLFDLYLKYTAPLIGTGKEKKKRAGKREKK